LRTIEYLSDPALAGIYWPMVLSAVAIALICCALSVTVVLKRLVFIGQGVSHAAFGGVGVAYMLGVTGVGSAQQRVGLFVIVLGFCVLASLTIARYGKRERADRVIGIVLVSAMAIGFLLIEPASRREVSAGRPAPAGVESVLFGSLGGVGGENAMLAWIVAAGVLGTGWILRRKILFWGFDEPGAEAFGVRTGHVRAVVMVLLALAIVTTMRLAGVILATALLVLPATIALQLSRRHAVVVTLTFACGLLGVLGGLVVSFELDLQPGPSVVAALLVLLAASSIVGLLVRPGYDARRRETP